MMSAIRHILAYINPNIRDKTSPIIVTLNYTITGSSIHELNVPKPIINQLETGIKPLVLTLPKSCVSCRPDLTINGKF